MSKYLDVNNEAVGQKMLVDVVSMQVLDMVGRSRGDTELAAKLVNSYKNSYAA